MGITSAEVAFPHRALPLPEICAKATELCSLSVVVLESHTDKLLEFHGSIAFECAQGEYRREFGQPITESELLERLRKAKRHMRRIEWTLILMLPILIPWFVVVSIWALVTTLFRRRHRLR